MSVEHDAEAAGAATDAKGSDGSTGRTETTPPDEPTGQTPVEQVHFEVLPWVRRVGTNSWMFTGVMIALALITVLIAATRSITAPLAVGVFVAVVCVPIVTWLEKHGVKRAAGAGIVVAGLFVVFAGCAFITAEALWSQSDAISENLQSAVDDIKTWAEDLPINAGAVDAVDSTAADGVAVGRRGGGR